MEHMRRHGGHSIHHHEDSVHHEHAGEHVAGHTRQMEEEHRKESFFREFHHDANTSNTKYHEEHHDRNK